MSLITARCWRSTPIVAGGVSAGGGILCGAIGGGRGGCQALSMLPRVITSVTERGLPAPWLCVHRSARVWRCHGWVAGILIVSADTASMHSTTRCTGIRPHRSAMTGGQSSEVRQRGRHMACASMHLRTPPMFTILAGLRRRERIRASAAGSSRPARFGHCYQSSGATASVRRAPVVAMERKLPALPYIAGSKQV